MNKTQEAAELMLGNGWFDAKTLGKAMDRSAHEASGYLYNIANSKKYQVETTRLPNRKFRLLAINDSNGVRSRRMSKPDMLKLVLFGGGYAK